MYTLLTTSLSDKRQGVGPEQRRAVVDYIMIYGRQQKIPMKQRLEVIILQAVGWATRDRADIVSDKARIGLYTTQTASFFVLFLILSSNRIWKFQKNVTSFPHKNEKCLMKRKIEKHQRERKDGKTKLAESLSSSIQVEYKIFCIFTFYKHVFRSRLKRNKPGDEPWRKGLGKTTELVRFSYPKC